MLRLALGASVFAVGCGQGPRLGELGGDGESNGVQPTNGLEPQPDGGAPTVVDHPEELGESIHFPLGVATGDVTMESVVLWTRYAHSRSLVLRIWDGETSEFERLAEIPVTPSAGGFVNLVLEGLTAGRRYRFAFHEMENGEPTGRSPIGRFRAAPAASSLETITLGAVSCTKQGKSLQSLMRAAERTDLSAFLLLGDTSYNDGAVTLDEYRAKWASSLSRGEYLRLRQAMPVIATWDDHEVDNGWNPETISQAQKSAAFDTFFESLPVRRSNAASNRIWRSFRYGATVEVFVLDTRSERTPSDKKLYVSREQMDWLKAGLSASTAVFKLVMNSVPVGSFPFSAFSDGWTGYPEQRTEILQHIADNALRGVVWLSGDFHLASLGRISGSGLGSDMLEVLAGPGGQTGNYAASTLGGSQFDWATAENNYAALKFDPASREMTATFVKASGSTIQERVYVL